MTRPSELANPDFLEPTPATMRHVLGHFCTGVAIITAHDGQRPVGFTCQSVTSVSLNPPYISFCPSRTSTSWPLIRPLGALCVNVLAADQGDICALFATSGADRFGSIPWRHGTNGAPVVDGALACIEAQIQAEHDAGDHTIVVARVTALQAHNERDPLLFFRGGFGQFDARMDR